MDELKPYIPTIITAILFIWSEYLGVTTKHKSNAIIQLLLCMLSRDKENQSIELTPPTVIVTPPATPSPSSK